MNLVFFIFYKVFFKKKHKIGCSKSIRKGYPKEGLYKVEKNNSQKSMTFGNYSCAPLGARTLDPGIKSAVLYQLS